MSGVYSIIIMSKKVHFNKCQKKSAQRALSAILSAIVVGFTVSLISFTYPSPFLSRILNLVFSFCCVECGIHQMMSTSQHGEKGRKTAYTIPQVLFLWLICSLQFPIYQDVSILLLPDLELLGQLMVTLHSIDKGIVCYITHQVMPLRLTAMLLIVRTNDIHLHTK